MKFLHLAKAYVVLRLSRFVAPRYQPPVLYAEGGALAARVAKVFEDGIILGRSATEDLLERGIAKGVISKKAGSKAKTLTSREILVNIQATAEKLRRSCKEADPDEIAAHLVKDFCVGIPHMAQFDNQRRTTAVWSAIALPLVVLREHSGRPFTEKELIEAALHWLEHGYTKEAKIINGFRQTRRFSGHPARMYELLADSAQSFNLDHGELMRAMIEPVIGALAYHAGACEVAKRELVKK